MTERNDMAYYNVCAICGSNLDPGEKCTCTELRTRQQEFFSRHLKVSKTGQLTFAFDDELIEESYQTGGRNFE